MSAFEERQKEFESEVRKQTGISASARLSGNFGLSNSARLVQGGLFVGSANLESYTKSISKDSSKREDQFIFLSMITFPPQDEVYFAVVVTVEANRINDGLIKLAKQIEAKNAKKSGGAPLSKINNNLAVYVNENGELIFNNNPFLSSVTEANNDPDCKASVDSVLFSIWPPNISANRSLLAREFVGRIGELVGTAKVHEIQVWKAESSISPKMKRMPKDIDLAEIQQAIESLGGFYRDGEVRRLHAALNFHPTKHFVILSGLSGAGKTQLAIMYALAVHGVTSLRDDPLLYICPVRPEWTDPTALLGYFDVLSNRYVVPEFLRAILLATAHKDSPVFILLDELNLARVEYYFSDILSAIETGQELNLHSQGVPVEGTTGTSIRSAIPLPPNVFIIGTINVDETTSPISDKVLDRASLIEMLKIDLDGFIEDLTKREPSLKEAAKECGDALVAVHKILTSYQLGFGYRVAEEVLRYLGFAQTNLKLPPTEVLDELMVQKILVKLRGTEKHRPMLEELRAQLSGQQKSVQLLDRLQEDLNEFGSFQASR